MQNKSGKIPSKETGNHGTESKNTPILNEQRDALVKLGESKLQSKEHELKQLEQKVIQIDLIKEVASMYKEYLQSIFDAIKLKFLTEKPERYQKQIAIISKETERLKNLETYLGTLKNYNELKNLNVNDIVNKMIVSEEKLSQTGFMDQPFGNALFYHEATIDGVNEGYEDIKKMLLTPNLTREKANEIKLKIFAKIRRFDVLGTDDNGLVLDTGNPISSRIVPDILQNKDLRKKPDINTTFAILEKFGYKEKKDLFNSLKGGKENLKIFLTHSKVLDTLGLKTLEDKKAFIDELYKNLKENLSKINDVSVSEELKKQINKEFDFQLQRVPKEKKSELEAKRKEALKSEYVSLGVQTLKQEAIFMIFEKMCMNQVLENNSKLVESISKTNRAVDLYRDIEGIGNTVSDERLNAISIGTQFLTEQIAIMLVSGVIGGMVLKGGGLLMKSIPVSQNLPWALKWTTGTIVEGTGFYLGYTGINGAVHEEKLGEIMKNYSHYDLARTIVFLGVLRAIPLDKTKEMMSVQNKTLNELKNISLDTTAILGTDVIIRGASQLFTGKEGFKTNVDGEVTLDSIGEFVVEELAFIIPLIIGLRQSDKAVASLFENGKKPQISVTPKDNEFIIQIEGLKKDIRILRQQRNILRNKGKSTQEINEKLKITKKEYKEKRDENVQNIAKSGTGNTDTQTAVLPTSTQHQNLIDNSKQNRDTNNQRDNVNMNTGVRILQDVLSKKNIEDVMKGFQGVNLSPKFQTLLSKGGDKYQAEKLISQEVDLKVKELEKTGVKIDPVEGELFIKRFKAERIAEFEQLIKIKEQGGKIPENMKVNYKGREWDLKLRDVKGMNEYFERYVKKGDKIEEQNKPVNLILKK